MKLVVMSIIFVSTILSGMAKGESPNEYFNGGVNLRICNSESENICKDKSFQVYFKDGKFTLCYECEDKCYFLTPKSDKDNETGRDAFIRYLKKFLEMEKKNPNREMELMGKLPVKVIVVEGKESENADEKLGLAIEENELVMLVTGYNHLTLFIDKEDIPELIKICQRPSK